MWQSPDGMEPYLSATELCDSDSKSIKAKARELAQGAARSYEAAVSVFYFVRDRIRYGLNRFDAKASETLKRRVGTCVHKSTLQIALLRSLGIPARYHHVVLDSEILEGILAPIVYERMPAQITFHSWCECWCAGRWVACEALFDKRLYEGAVRAGVLSRERMPAIDWEGGPDLVTVSSWIKEDKGPFDCLDDLFTEVERDAHSSQLVNRVGYWLSNQHTHRLRWR